MKLEKYIKSAWPYRKRSFPSEHNVLRQEFWQALLDCLHSDDIFECYLWIRKLKVGDLGNVVCDKMEPIYRNGHATKSHWWATLYTFLRHFQVFDLYRKEEDLGSENDENKMSLICIYRTKSLNPHLQSYFLSYGTKYKICHKTLYKVALSVRFCGMPISADRFHLITNDIALFYQTRFYDRKYGAFEQ